MAWMKNIAIKYKLIFIIMATSTIVLFVGFGSFLSWQWKSARTAMINNLCTQARIISKGAEAALVEGNKNNATEVLEILKANASITFAIIFDDTDSVFATYKRDRHGVITLPFTPAKQGYQLTNVRITVFEPIYRDGKKIGRVCVQSDFGPTYRMIKRSFYIAAFVLGLSLVVAYVVSARFQKIISGPISSLTEVAKVVSGEKQYHARASKTTNDETGLLVDAFNEMLDKIQDDQKKLLKANRDLEIKVKERTADLTSANEHLKSEVEVRQRAETGLRHSEQFLQSTLNALSSHIAILEQNGRIVAVNKAWRQFAQDNGLGMSDFGIGANYLEICDTAGQLGPAMQAARGIREVMADKKEEFYLEYPCHSPEKKRWFAVSVTGFEKSVCIRCIPRP